MATKADADAAGANAAGPAPDAEQVYRLVGDLVRFFSPEAREVCITYRVPGQQEPGRIPVPMAAAPGDFRAAVESVLRRLRPGEWMKGRTIAAELDMEYEGGHFRKEMARLVRDGVIASDQHKGYCLPGG